MSAAAECLTDNVHTVTSADPIQHETCSMAGVGFHLVLLKSGPAATAGISAAPATTIISNYVSWNHHYQVYLANVYCDVQGECKQEALLWQSGQPSAVLS